jgi:hypothetical protein
MSIRGAGQTTTITNNLRLLNIIGVSNKIIIKAHIYSIDISGTNNQVEGLDPSCKVDKLMISGLGNDVNLNQNCSNVQLSITGLRNNFKINGNQVSRNNNYNNNVQMFNGQRVITISNLNGQNLFNDLNINFNGMNLNNYNNVNDSNINNNDNNVNDDDDNNDDNNDNDNQVDEEFEQKKKKLILEMDEFQYKHIGKYESRKETQCAICLSDFKNVDIIKVFYTCDHIFHKKCLLEWLKKSNSCPLCNHDLTNDIE